MQNRRKTELIALTGGIGSGKSLALEIIKNSGVFTLSCDALVTELYKKRAFLLKLKSLFPGQVSVLKAEVNRKEISKTIFSDAEKRIKLNALVHPKVIKLAFKIINKAKQNKAVLEVPLLFESNLEEHFNKIIVVIRDINEREKSLLERGLTKEEIVSRINSQVDYEKKDLSKYVIIQNNGTKTHLKEQLLKVI